MKDFIVSIPLSGERFRVVYHLGGSETAARSQAEDLCVEQTIEFPADLVKGGDIRRHGPGLSFWYWPWNTSIASIPVVRRDTHFVFTETTANYQEISIQGQLTYRLARPLEVAKVLDFTIDPGTRQYRSQDPEKLVQRIINAVQANTRSGVNALSLEDALIRVKQLSDEVLESVRQEPDLVEFGVVVRHHCITQLGNIRKFTFTRILN